MKKWLLVATVAALSLAPFASQADDIPDGADCAAGADPITLAVVDGGEEDRGAVCVAAEGTVVLYVGGEAQAEEEGDPAAGGSCGAVIVAGTALAGEPDWDNAGEDGEAGTEDDEHCD